MVDIYTFSCNITHSNSFSSKHMVDMSDRKCARIWLLFLTFILFFSVLVSGCGKAVGTMRSKLPIENGFQVNNVSNNFQAEGWLNGKTLSKTSIDPDESARFGVDIGDHDVEATLTVTVREPGDRSKTVYQIEREFDEYDQRVIAVTIEGYEGGPAVFVHDGDDKVSVPPVE